MSPPEEIRRPAGSDPRAAEEADRAAENRPACPNCPELDTWPEFSAFLFVRPEPCRRCSGRVLARYYFDEDRRDCGWGASPLDTCGDPDRCAEKLIGCTFVEAVWGTWR
jgi:hypothetical protein